MADQILQEIKDRLNIADIIGGYIQLKKAGTNFRAVCPFHSEKTPSLMVSPQKQIWHCFGCGEGGDVFGFVMRYENLEFKDALKLLADKAGVQLPRYSQADKAAEDEKELLLRINSFAGRYYNSVLNSASGKEALEYLKNRGLSEATIKQWQIGFALDNFHALETALKQKSKNITNEQLLKAGVAAKSESGQLYDRFRGRITFPIFDYFGQVVGFSARILKDDANLAKYVNSPETLIYNKSRVLFGLNFAKDEIRKKDEMVIVEGQMDCISLHQAGFKNVIASSGTAYNEQSVGFTMARRLTKNIKLCFDADSAGQNALRKAGEMLLKLGFRLKVIVLKAVKDPDELVKKSPGLWAKAASEAVWFLDFNMNLAKEKFKEDPVAQKHYLSEEVVPFLGFIVDPLEQDHYINELVKNFDISEKVIRAQITNKNVIPSRENIKVASLAINPNVLEKEVLGGLLFVPEFFNDAKTKLQPEDFLDYSIRQLTQEVLQNGQISADSQSLAVVKEAIFVVESQLAELENNSKLFLKQLHKSLALLKLQSIKRQQKILGQEMKSAESRGDKAKLQELNQEFARLGNARMQYEDQI